MSIGSLRSDLQLRSLHQAQFELCKNREQPLKLISCFGHIKGKVLFPLLWTNSLIYKSLGGEDDGKRVKAKGSSRTII